jgi:predicted HicB family RNase H-like nuclease
VAVINDYCSEGAREGRLAGGEKEMKNRKIETITTKQIVIDKGLHQLLKLEATRAGKSIKELAEGFIAEELGTDYQKNDKR